MYHFADTDCVVLLTDHTDLDRDLLVRHAPVILDTRNALKGAAGSVVPL